MKRITDRNQELPELNSNNSAIWRRAYLQLAEYEDLGMTPAEIREKLNIEEE